MPTLSANDERKFLRYVGQDVNAVYIKRVKAYGKNIWRFPLSGGTTTSSNYGTWSLSNISGNFEHHSITYASTGANTSEALKSYGGLKTEPISVSKAYSFQIQVKSTLPTARLYIYIYGQSNPVRAYKLDNLKSDEFTSFVLENLSSVDGLAASDTYTGTLYIGFTRSDYVGAANTSYFVGHTIEIKNMKLEEGSISPYSINSTLL